VDPDIAVGEGLASEECFVSVDLDDETSLCLNAFEMADRRWDVDTNLTDPASNRRSGQPPR
jgi:hypothetical protein